MLRGKSHNHLLGAAATNGLPRDAKESKNGERTLALSVTMLPIAEGKTRKGWRPPLGARKKSCSAENLFSK